MSESENEPIEKPGDEWFMNKGGNMSDKRQEFVGKWASKIDREFNDSYPDYCKALDKMLLDYDKLNGDKLERLKEFVKNRRKELMPSYDSCCQVMVELKKILAEISRLEKQHDNRKI